MKCWLKTITKLRPTSNWVWGTFWHYITPPKTNECPLKRDHFSRECIWTNHWFHDMWVFRWFLGFSHGFLLVQLSSDALFSMSTKQSKTRQCTVPPQQMVTCESLSNRKSKSEIPPKNTTKFLEPKSPIPLQASQHKLLYSLPLWHTHTPIAPSLVLLETNQATLGEKLHHGTMSLTQGTGKGHTAMQRNAVQLLLWHPRCLGRTLEVLGKIDV